jgi:hypothetical protein
MLLQLLILAEEEVKGYSSLWEVFFFAAALFLAAIVNILKKK